MGSVLGGSEKREQDPWEFLSRWLTEYDGYYLRIYQNPCVSFGTSKGCRPMTGGDSDTKTGTKVLYWPALGPQLGGSAFEMFLRRLGVLGSSLCHAAYIYILYMHIYTYTYTYFPLFMASTNPVYHSKH